MCCEGEDTGAHRGQKHPIPPTAGVMGGARNSPTWIRGDKLWSLQEPSTLLALRVVTDLKMRFTQCDNTQHILTS